MKLVISIVLVSVATARANPPQPSAIDPGAMNEAYQQQQAEQNAQTQATAGALNAGAGWLSLGIQLVRSAHDLTDSYAALSTFDATCMDLSPGGAPAVPASCADQGAACGECYTGAVHELNGMRLNLERLRCTFRAYKDFVDKSIAFGDTASGIHAVTGLEWQTQKSGILEAMHSLENTYDTKYHQMMPNLEAALRHMATCEAQYFHSSDWYERFGFIYYSFMADRYKR
jgi:hypothetical protein